MIRLPAEILIVIVLISFSLGEGIQPADSIDIYIVSHGWHTGIVLPVQNIENQILRSLAEADSTHYVEIGWGEYDFYRDPDPGAMSYLKASLWPTASAVHIVRIYTDIEHYFPYSDIIQFRISSLQFDAICIFIENALMKSEKGQLIDGGPGIYGDSRFYMGSEKYYFPKTCNVWTAELLTHAGIDLNPVFHQRAAPLMDALAKHGRVIRKRSD